MSTDKAFTERSKKALPFTVRFLIVVPGYGLVTGAAYYFGFVDDQWAWTAFLGGIAICGGAIALGLVFDTGRALLKNKSMQSLARGVPCTLIVLLFVPLWSAIVATLHYSRLVGDEGLDRAISGGLALFVGAMALGLVADGARALWHRI